MAERIRPVKTPIPKDTTGLSWWYRLTWRLEYLGVSVTGPGEQPLARDPRERLRRERTQRVADNVAAGGRQQP